MIKFKMNSLLLVSVASFILGLDANFNIIKKATYKVNGQEVSEETFNQIKSGHKPMGGIGLSKLPSRNPSLSGSSYKNPFNQGSTVTYIVNGKPVTEEEFQKISASRQPSLPSGGMTSPTYGKPVKGQSNNQTPQGSAKLSESTKQAVVDAHNSYREQLAKGQVNGQPRATQMTKLTWDEGLANVASKWAEGCVFKHSKTDDHCGVSGLQSVGENLGTGTMRPTEEMISQEEISGRITNHVKNWFDEHSYYTYHGLRCQPGKMCGHYTQVVSDKSDKVGCAVAMCNNGVQGFVSQRAYLVVCNYGPAGNIQGEVPYETQQTSCPLDHPKREGVFCGGKRTAPVNCQDTSSGCLKWKSEGKCEMCHNPYYHSVTSQCPKTCGIC